MSGNLIAVEESDEGVRKAEYRGNICYISYGFKLINRKRLVCTSGHEEINSGNGRIKLYNGIGFKGGILSDEIDEEHKHKTPFEF